MYCVIIEETEGRSGELSCPWFHINTDIEDLKSVRVDLLRVIEGQ